LVYVGTNSRNRPLPPVTIKVDKGEQPVDAEGFLRRLVSVLLTTPPKPPKVKK
jgi:hypothetical protein